MFDVSRSKNKIRESASRRAFLLVNSIMFGIILFICLYPLWYVLIQSLSEGDKAVSAIVLPINFTLSNYISVMQRPDILSAFGISVVRTLTGTCGTVLCCMLLGYLFSKEEMPCRKFLYRMLIITGYVGGGMIPTYLIFRFYGLLNNFMVYILPSLISSYYVILIKTFVEQMPPEVEESAMIDGAGPMNIFIRIILPLSLPIAATIAIYSSVHHWNSWFDNQLYTVTNEKLTTLQFLLYSYLNKTEAMLEAIERGDVSESSVMMTPAA